MTSKLCSVAITGASGFVGSRLTETLSRNPVYSVTIFVRALSVVAKGVLIKKIKDLSDLADAGDFLHGVDCIVHTAARVHIMNEQAPDSLEEFRRVNVDATTKIARAAANAGVRRFIFLSSIKVNGEETKMGQPFKPDDTPGPVDPYGQSKMEAELALQAIAIETGMEVVIIRPVLVYGPGVKANFLALMKWLKKGVPLPLGCIKNKRSLVSVDNLIDLIVTCTVHPKAANQTFLVSDGEDVSTPELLRRMGRAMKKPVRLLFVPSSILKAAAKLLGKGPIAQRICGSLQVDITKTKELLGWSPPVTLDEALSEVAKHFLEVHKI